MKRDAPARKGGDRMLHWARILASVATICLDVVAIVLAVRCLREG